MENGQLKTPETIPLPPLPPTLDDLLALGSSVAMNEEITSVIKECEKETANGINMTEHVSIIDNPVPGHQELIRKAVREHDIEYVKRYLAEGFIQALIPTYPHLRDNDAKPILHYCIEEYCRNYRHNLPAKIEIIKEILATAEQAENKSILNTLYKDGRSPLCLAIELGCFEVVKALIKSEANVEHVSDIKETALHVAVQRPDILKYLLHNLQHDKAEKAAKSFDTRGYAPIHAAAKFEEVHSFNLLLNKFGKEQLTLKTNFDRSTALHLAAENGATKIVEIIIKKPITTISYTDIMEETALNKSAKHGHKAVTALLLCNGAVLSDKGLEERTAVEQIAKKFSDPSKFLEDVFDEFITITDSSATFKQSEVRVNYDVLNGSDCKSMSQIKVIEELVRCGQSELLLHPLIESLLYLKWRCLLPVFYTMIALYAFFLSCFNAFLVTTFYTRDYNASALSDCSNSFNETNKDNCSNSFNETNADNCSNSFNETNVQYHKCFDVYDWIWIVLIYISIFLLLVQEIFIYIYLLRCRYWKQYESYVKLVLLALAAVVPPGVICGPEDWHRHVSCAALLLSWLQAMLLLSRFPDWGYYVPMFWSVAYNIFKILRMLIWLVVAFSFCFMIQYRSESPFDGPEAAFVKTLAMMSSEFDYEGLFAEGHNAALCHTRSLVRLLFVIFVMFIAIVLMNVITGIAVSDINELNKKANIRRLEKQVEQLSTLEDLADTELFKSLDHIKYHYKISKGIESVEKWKVDSFDKYEQCLTPELENAIINVAKKKAQRQKDRHKKNEKKNRLDAMYDTLMKLPPYLERDRQEGEAKALDEKMFYNNTEASILMMQNKITSLEFSMNELKDNMKKKLAIMTANGTIRNEKTRRCDHLTYEKSSSLTNTAHCVKSFSL